jgi:hypothetical protein
MNSSPEDKEIIDSIIPPYSQFVEAGYTDGCKIIIKRRGSPVVRLKIC